MYQFIDDAASLLNVLFFLHSYCSEYFDIVVHTWEPFILEK